MTEPERPERQRSPAAAEETALADDPSVRHSLELTFVGDVIFGRYRPPGYDPIPEDGYDVFAPLRSQLASDLLIGNLETPLADRLPRRSPIASPYAFGAAREHAELLVGAGFAAMSLANNHWYDLRWKGVRRTPELLQELGITPLGSARRKPERFRVETLERHGWRIGIVAITTRTNSPVPDDGLGPPYLATGAISSKIGPLVRTAEHDHDLVVVLVHWGHEYEDVPDPKQVRAARALVEAGADLVIGHHPHVLQGVERHRGGLIAYSLGNFLFEHAGSKPRQTGVLRVRVRPDSCLERVVFHPAYVTRKPVKHPVPATGAMGKQVRGRVRKLSARFGTRWKRVGEDLELVTRECATYALDEPTR